MHICITWPQWVNINVNIHKMWREWRGHGMRSFNACPEPNLNIGWLKISALVTWHMAIPSAWCPTWEFADYHTDTYLLLLISILWHRQAIFKSKGDKLCSSAECRIWTQGPRHQIASRLNARWQTDWAIEDQAKTLNSTARPYDQRAFSPLDPTVSWLSHLALAVYIFVVGNFDALAQASDIQIERRQVVFLCWMQDLNPGTWKHLLHYWSPCIGQWWIHQQEGHWWGSLTHWPLQDLSTVSNY